MCLNENHQNKSANTFNFKEYPDYKYKPRKKLKPHERGHKPRGRRPANPDAPRKPRNARTNVPRKRGKAKLLLASLRQGRASMAPLTQGPASQPQPGNTCSTERVIPSRIVSAAECDIAYFLRSKNVLQLDLL